MYTIDQLSAYLEFDSQVLLVYWHMGIWMPPCLLLLKEPLIIFECKGEVALGSIVLLEEVLANEIPLPLIIIDNNFP